MSRDVASPGAEAAAAAPAQLAKAALRRLALERQEPTPENFARAYQAERGGAPPAPAGTEPGADGAAWAMLIERAVRGLERGGRQWTTARKKDSLQRVLGGSRSDARRLQQRLGQLLSSWDSDSPDGAASDFAAFDEPAPAATASAPAPLDLPVEPPLAVAAAPAATARHPDAAAWPRVAADLGATVQAALPASEARGREVADRLAGLQARLGPEGPAALRDEISDACIDIQRVLQHRHHLLGQLGELARELTEGLVDLAEDDSWVQGQCGAMRAQLFDSDTGLTARGVRSVTELLHDTRGRQRRLRVERGAAREALKASIHQMLDEIAALGAQTGRFSERLGDYAEAIDSADSLDSLAGTVRAMVAESRAVAEGVSQTQQRLVSEHDRASQMQARVAELEVEIRRLSSEVSTDPLTQVANRRGLLQAFEIEQARSERDAIDGRPALAVALIDIDNFKKLNDRLGHASGDEALKFLTRRVGEALRPGDTLARYGGEEFVVLLPATPIDEARQVLTRLQRALSAELFMSDAQGQVFVTFSAGVTPYRGGERLEQALERADEALYEAKRTGKNRTCAA
ncbi:MAG TPA: GGDEF domain-containing protein [Methylibium sp.]|nr:GGDEF domain-containing protein [Methylibium sp.]